MLPLKQHSKRRDDVEDKLNKSYCRGCRWSISKGGKEVMTSPRLEGRGFESLDLGCYPLAEGVMVSSIISSRPGSKLYSKAGDLGSRNPQVLDFNQILSSLLWRCAFRAPEV
jgi:hypothetical protein